VSDGSDFQYRQRPNIQLPVPEFAIPLLGSRSNKRETFSQGVLVRHKIGEDVDLRPAL
jgi:hypothetical protein